MKKYEWKRSDRNIFGDKSDIYPSLVAENIFRMVISGIGSNCHYFAYESALEDSFGLNVLRKMKNGCNILRYKHCDRKSNFARGTIKVVIPSDRA